MIDVVALLEALGIKARRRGREYWAPCPSPDHVDDEPSWHIRDSPGADRHGSHHCFGCHFGGGPVELVAAVYDFASVSSARSWIEEKGIDSEDIAPLEVVVEVTTPFRIPFSIPVGCQTAKLEDWPTTARRYVRGRGITPAQVRRWAIHYGVDGDLRGRIVFPFTDLDGVMRSYSARTFTGDSLRYRTPDLEEEGGDPDAMFGPHWWPALGDRRLLVVTEGAIDALACERVGAAAIVALNGSSLSPSQALAIGTFPMVAIATDPDGAGDRIADELLAFARWIDVRRVRIPKGKDAAAMTPARLKEALRRATLHRNR